MLSPFSYFKKIYQYSPLWDGLGSLLPLTSTALLDEVADFDFVKSQKKSIFLLTVKKNFHNNNIRNINCKDGRPKEKVIIRNDFFLVVFTVSRAHK